jgi:predicted DNA-binding transcriptional regulator AlpA
VLSILNIARMLRFVNYRERAMKVDPDELIDSPEVASILGLSHGNAISVYRKRYKDFPLPVVTRGRCLLWVRRDIEAWARTTGRLRGGGR